MSTISDALSALAAGRAIVLPTDTVYGIGAYPDDEAAVASIFATKGRPEEKALPILGATVDELRSVARFDEAAMALAERWWPGPLTLVLPRAEGFTDDLGGSDPTTVAVRIPALALTLDLLSRSGPLAVTSANLSGQPEARTAQEARIALGTSIDVFLDGGAVAGAPSTVVSLVGVPAVLREGAVAAGDVLALLEELDV